MPDQATRIIGDNDMRFRFKDVFPTYTTWYRTFVQSEGMDIILNETHQPFTISFHPAHPWSSHVANAGCNILVRADVGAMDSATAERLAERARRRRDTDRGNQVQARSARRREVDAEVNSHILEDTAAIVLDDGTTTKQFNLITFGSTVYCPRCESKDTPEGHRGIGDPSARVFPTDAGDRALHCFSCRSTLFAATTFKRDPMEVLPNERIVFTDPTWRINSHGRTDLSVAAGVRLLAISAATGLGKSTFIRSILNDRLRATVCAMSYRESIAKYQAQEWNLTNYKEDGAFTEHNVARISTCIHSITRIPTHMAYDIVVLDEADAIRMSLGDSTMDRRYHLVYQRLCGIMRSASLVILLQSDLSQDVVTWASDLCMVDAEDRSFVQRSCIMTPRRLYPMASSDDLGVVLAQLQHFYKSNWDPRRSRARFPTLVFCTQKTFAASLYAMFKSFCTPEQRPGIRLVTRDTCAQDDWVQGFIKDPNAETSGADIVFASPVLSAGLSLDCHYTAGFYFLHKGIIAHDAEYQMTQRLRHQARTDEMHAYVYAYIEKGCGDENLASKERLSQMYFSLVSTARTDAGMGLGLGGAGSFRLQIQAEAAAEFADSRNRHAWLWQERYNGHVLVKIGGAEVPITSSEAERANLLAVLNKYVRNRSICVANWHLEDPLADLRAVADGELHAEVASQVLFEASIKADMLMDALIRSNRFKDDILRDVAVRLQHECTAHHAPWLGAFAFDRWLSLVLFETGLKKDPWMWRSKAIGDVSRHASALAGSELLRAMQNFLYTDFAIDGDRDLGIIAPGDTIDLSEGSEDERRIMEFRLRCANPQSAEYRLWNATNQKKIVAGDKGVYNTAYKFIKRVYHLGCGVPLRRSADGSGATWSSDYLNCTVLALLATRHDSLIEDWHMLRSYDLDCAVERAEAILDEWSHSNVMPMDVEDVEDVEET